jgi:phytanoyl-CoA hydroxylase
MIDQMGKLVDAWTPGDQQAVFRTDDKQIDNQGSSDYFLDSADRIHFFTEAGAVDEAGALMPNVRKEESLNKAGHGLHASDPVFKEYSTSDKVKKLVSQRLSTALNGSKCVSVFCNRCP